MQVQKQQACAWPVYFYYCCIGKHKLFLLKKDKYLKCVCPVTMHRVQEKTQGKHTSDIVSTAFAPSINGTFLTWILNVYLAI